MTHLFFWGQSFTTWQLKKPGCHQIIEMFFWGKKNGPKYSHISRGEKRLKSPNL
jgi:hypothetical protein